MPHFPSTRMPPAGQVGRRARFPIPVRRGLTYVVVLDSRGCELPMNMERLTPISRSFDEAFSTSLKLSHQAFQEELAATSQTLNERFRDDVYAVLQIKRSYLERMVIGAIHFGMPPAECWSMFRDREALGYDSPVSRWLILQNVLRYCEGDRAISAGQIDELLTSLRGSLVETFEGCRECLAQIENRNGE